MVSQWHVFLFQNVVVTQLAGDLLYIIYCYYFIISSFLEYKCCFEQLLKLISFSKLSNIVWHRNIFGFNQNSIRIFVISYPMNSPMTKWFIYHRVLWIPLYFEHFTIVKSIRVVIFWTKMQETKLKESVHGQLNLLYFHLGTIDATHHVKY